MIERDTVIIGLECCIIRHPDDKARCNQCPYDGACLNRLKSDALGLLKPRVLTLDEAKNAYVIEYKSGKMREVGSALLNINVDPLNAK